MQVPPLKLVDGPTLSVYRILVFGFTTVVSSRGSGNYEVANELARILGPLVEGFPHHIMKTGDFVQQVKGIKLQSKKCVPNGPIALEVGLDTILATYLLDAFS